MANVLSGKTDLRSLILTILVVIWALRLGSFLFRRILQDGKDSRFDEIKPNKWRFIVAWTIQGAWVFITTSCALAAITGSPSAPMTMLSWVGVGVWLVGFAIEAVADHQKSAFKKAPENADKFIQQGLWKVSRHPNYFGEIMLWIGICLIAAPVLSGWQWVTLISPIFVTLLLTRVSGIPMLEAKSDKRWGEDPDYQAYKQCTPVLIPFIGGR